MIISFLCDLNLEYFDFNQEEEGTLHQVDFEKALDTVEHNCLFKTMQLLRFGENLME